MEITDQKIKEILLSEDYVTKQDIKKAEEFAKSHHSSIIEYLITRGIITKDLLGQATAEFFNVPYADLNSKQPSREQVLEIPAKTAKNFRAVLFDKKDNQVIVTTDQPDQKELKPALKEVFKAKEIDIYYSLSEDVDEALINYRKPLETRFGKIIEAENRVAPEIIDEIIADASALRASDIHLEPQEKEIIVRFRVDGVLYEVGRIPKIYYDNILNRIKVQAHLRIDEHFSAQDGAIRYIGKKAEKPIDLRVSIIPTLDGEKVTTRLLSLYIQSFTLADLGLSANGQELVESQAKKPFGMILATGPTGSGKTTTLYALLKILNHPEVNITTIEDPVEYRIIGTNQIQVNPDTNLTFADGLRSIIRQDPDIILVGEIRDNETAEIAVNAALTGHLLLSTFHANDAPTAIPRLLDMGIEPFLLASTLEVIVAQRLARKICENCRHSVSTKQSDIIKILPQAELYFPEKTTDLYQGKGCKNCGGTGFRGRVAIFEIINVTKEIKDLILTNPSTKQIWDLAKSQGAQSLFEDGVEKVKNGVTTLEELLRVAAPVNHINHYDQNKTNQKTNKK